MVPVLLPRKSLICMWQIYEGRKWVLALAALIMLAVTWAEHGFFRHSAGVEENPGMDPKEINKQRMLSASAVFLF